MCFPVLAAGFLPLTLVGYGVSLHFRVATLLKIQFACHRSWLPPLKNDGKSTFVSLWCADLCTPTCSYRLAKLGTSLRVRGKLTLRKKEIKVFYMSKNKKQGNDTCHKAAQTTVKMSTDKVDGRGKCEQTVKEQFLQNDIEYLPVILERSEESGKGCKYSICFPVFDAGFLLLPLVGYGVSLHFRVATLLKYNSLAIAPNYHRSRMTARVLLFLYDVLVYVDLSLSPRRFGISLHFWGKPTLRKKGIIVFNKQYSMTCLVFLKDRKAGNEIEIIKECRLMAAFFGVQNSFWKYDIYEFPAYDFLFLRRLLYWSAIPFL